MTRPIPRRARFASALAILAVTTIGAMTPLRAAAEETVTPETFIRAESDRMFHDLARQTGGGNKFYHYRNVTPLDKQTVIRMNRDTLYSVSIIDTEGGATITVPEFPDDRYFSVYITDNDHYVPEVIYTSGVHELPRDTKYIGVALRIQVFDPHDSDELAMVHDLQDKFVITASSADPLPDFKRDRKSLDALRAQYEKDAASDPSYAGMQGPRGTVNEDTRHIAAAAAWGLFPEQDATYLNYNPGLQSDQCYTATYKAPENKAFWSITVYGDTGFLESDNAIVNSSNVTLNDDGTFDVYFGSRAACGPWKANRLDTTDGRNFLMRIYRPGQSVLDGSYKLPEVHRYLRDTPENYIAEYPNQEQVRMMTAWLKDHEPGTFSFTGLVDPTDATVITPQATVNYGYNWFSLSDGPAIIRTPQYDKFFSVSIFDMKHNIPAVIANPDLPILLIRPGQPMPLGEFNIVELETDQGLAFTRMVVIDNLDEVMDLSKQIVMEGGKGDMHREVVKFSPNSEKAGLAAIEAAVPYLNPDVAFGYKSGDIGDLTLAGAVMLGQLGTPRDSVRFGTILAASQASAMPPSRPA
ncbi:MAG: DUF1254 domain-containing protein [Marinibacterium sp.]